MLCLAQGPILIAHAPAGIVYYEAVGLYSHPTKRLQLHVYDTCIHRCATGRGYCRQLESCVLASTWLTHGSRGMACMRQV